MTKITIDDKEYDTENMSDEAKGQFNALKYVQNELAKVQLHTAVLQTAKNSYIAAFKKSLGAEHDGEIVLESENIRFD